WATPPCSCCRTRAAATRTSPTRRCFAHSGVWRGCERIGGVRRQDRPLVDAGRGFRRRLLAPPDRRAASLGGRVRERDERARFGRLHRLREVEALRVRAAQLAQPLDLLGRLDALDDDALA